MNYKISQKVFEDLENIWLYAVETWSVQYADRYYNLIFDEFEFLAKNPLSGKDYGFIRRNYRCTKVKSHLIFYKYKAGEKQIEIVRILHQSLDVEDRLTERK